VWLFFWERTVSLEVKEERERRLSQLLQLPQPIRRFEHGRLVLWECRMFFEATNNFQYTPIIQPIMPNTSNSSFSDDEINVSSSSYEESFIDDDGSNSNSSNNDDDDNSCDRPYVRPRFTRSKSCPPLDKIPPNLFRF
jgi:hypothetical protein